MLSGCGDDSSSKSSSSTKSSTSETCHVTTKPTTEKKLDAAPEDAAALIKERGKPSVIVPKDEVSKLETIDIIEGAGDAVTEGATVTVQYVGVSQSDCKEFDSSWSRSAEPATFGLDQVIQGWSEGLVGMKPGGRRYLAIPGDLAYGNTDTGGGRPFGTLIFVVDLESIGAATPTAPTVQADAAALAAAEARGKPTATVPSPLPTTLTTTDDVVGTGAEVAAGQTVVAHYVGVDASGKEFDASWTRGQPATFGLDQVIEGWSKGLVGLKVGGRRTLVIPGSMAYGDTDNGDGRPFGTLIFVVDLVGAG
jgi:peptidylprolyl isomerase